MVAEKSKSSKIAKTKKTLTKTVSTKSSSKDEAKANTELAPKSTAIDVVNNLDLTNPESSKAIAKKLTANSNYLVLELSQTLKSKLLYKAQSEGLSIDDFAEELLAEGLVLRAWEIMERKVALRSDQSGRQNSGFGGGNSQQNNRPHHQHQHNNPNNKRHSNQRNHQQRQQNFNNNKLVDDKAAFMEYLRNQQDK